jgi:hypothetical protein
MDSTFQGVLIGVLSTVGASILVYAVITLERLWHTPARLDRIELIVPIMIRALLAILRCQKAGVCNGETDAAISEIEHHLSLSTLSKKR